MNAKPTTDSVLFDLALNLTELRADPNHTTATSEGALKVSLEALYLVIQTLDLFPQFQGSGSGSGLTQPLHDLQLALVSILQGIAHPMLTPKKVGKRVKSVEQQALMAWAAIAFDCMQKAEMTRKDAGDAVARELTGVRLNRGASGNSLRPPSGKTVAGWVNKMREGKGSAPATALVPWDNYNATRAVSKQQAPEVWTAWALEKLRRLVANRLILQSPPKKVEE